jgi:hypothetical protein
MDGLLTLDSRDGVCFSREDLIRFHADGAVCLRGFLPDDALHRVSGDLESLIQLIEEDHGLDCGPRPEPSRQIAWLSRRLLSLDKAVPGSQDTIHDAMSRSASLHHVASSSRTLTAVKALLSPVVSIHPRLILLMAMPENEWHLPLWHQDWYYNEGPYDTLTLYVPMQRTTAQNGSLRIALGEHHRGVLPHGNFDHGHKTKWHTIDPAVVPTFRRVVDTELDAGDALLFNSLAPHSARLNRSDSVRLVINLRFHNLCDAEFRRNQWRTGAIPQARAALARTPEKSLARTAAR